MVKFHCDECSQPLALEDSKIVIPQIVFEDGRRVRHMQNLHFCSPTHMSVFLLKASKAPILITPQDQGLLGAG